MKRSLKRSLNVLKNKTYKLFFCFLFVIGLQTGNFLFAQIDITVDSTSVKTDSTKTKKQKKIHKPTIPWKAALMSGCLPGLGQIYNRKYWKLPIVWGAIGATSYFMIDNHIKYIGYRDAYRSWVNDSIILSGYEKYQYNPTGLRTERDNYERTRNIFIIVTAALWTLNIVDAAVDAHLSSFDVSPNLSMKVEPATFYNAYMNQPGFGVSLTFNLK